MHGVATPVFIEGTVYDSVASAAAELGFAVSTVRVRILSRDSRWFHWRYARKGESVEVRGNHLRRIMVNGVIYPSVEEASRKLGISDDALRARARSKSPHFESYRYVGQQKRVMRRRKGIVVYVHGKSYPSIREAAVQEGVTEGAIKHYLKYPDRFPNCYLYDVVEKKRV